MPRGDVDAFGDCTDFMLGSFSRSGPPASVMVAETSLPRGLPLPVHQVDMERESRILLKRNPLFSKKSKIKIKRLWTHGGSTKRSSTSYASNPPSQHRCASSGELARRQSPARPKKSSCQLPDHPARVFDS